MKPPIRWILVLALVLVSVSLAADQVRFLGRSLVEVLQEMRSDGLNLVFSSAVVSADLVVTVEPESSDAAGILGEILPPLGLAARPGPSGATLIVKASPSRPAGTLRGRILSAGLGTPIARATLQLRGTTIHGTSGPTGEYVISRVPAGVYDLVVEAPGFEEFTVSAVEIQDGAVVPLQIRLKAQPTYMAEVVVTPGKVSILRQDQTAGLAVDMDDAVLAPTLGGDVSRVVESLPGVAAADNTAAFNVRGAEARDVAMVLDGLELIEPFHLQRFQNPFSFVDAMLVDRLDFYAGAFTADFGDRHGGFVMMSTETPLVRRRNRIQVGTINSRVAIEAPLPKARGSWLVSARTWYPEELWDTLELGEGGLQPRFQDLYAKLSLNVSPRTVLSAHGLFAAERLKFSDTEDDESTDATTHSGYFWLRAQNSWTRGWYSETVLSNGRFRRTRSGVSAPEADVVSVRDNREVTFAGLKHDSTFELTDSQMLKAGFDIRWLAAEYDYFLRDEDGSDLVPAIALDPRGTSLGLYVAHRASLHPRLAAEFGLRWDKQTYAADSQLGPRVNAVWQVGEKSELRFGLGRYYQSQRIHELHVEDGEIDFLPAELSRQAEVTFDKRFASGYRLRAGAYYHTLSHLKTRYENLLNPVELYPETEADRVAVAPDKAVLQGIELFVSSPSQHPLHGWASYTLASAEDEIDGADVPRGWDQAHAVKFLIGYRNNDRWSVVLSGSAHTGWPTTPGFAGEVTLPDGSSEFQRVLGTRNSIRLADYLRLDARAVRSFHTAHGDLRLELELVNLTDRNNVCCVDDYLLLPNMDGSVDVEPELNYWLGITPTFSLLWEF
ncbi:MAG: TonB-dependent receptor [Acidobacteria bacterium]|uniref:TonB-dependent receptor n=1 Tax=Candidatus Polarisedimenticola svalbardensis TaxID=2886004 RepID=A0A8J7C2F9_9BACT|nr:TonB-dependent receptor [Candidatus Polarisedimenticola svalbardensis]